MSQAGYVGVALANELDVSSYHTRLNVSVTRAAADLSPYGTRPKTYLAGQADGSYALAGNWNDDAAADLELATNLGADVVISFFPAGAGAIGNAAFLVNGLENGYNITSQVTDAVRHAVSGVAKPAHMGGQLLHALGAASVGASASADGAASSSFGGVAHLHLTAFSGTSITVDLEDSANDSTFAALASFAAKTGVSHERITFAGVVERYVRVNISGTFTTATLAVAFARSRY